MADLRTLVRDEMERAGSPSYSFDDLGRRRDRKRRNQRIAAGVVGIAVFVAAVWIVTSVGSLDRSETPAVPGPAETGPAVTEPPLVTGPTETGPEPTAPPEAGWDGQGLPPEGTRLSTPVEGEVVAQAGLYHFYLAVYADGRVLSWQAGSGYVRERRLTPEGVAGVRSGAIKHSQFLTLPMEVPEDAWVDAEGKPYAPPRYSLCLQGLTIFGEAPNLTEPGAVDMLPAPAKALLLGQDPDPVNTGCLVVTTEDARAFRRLMTAAGLPRAPRLHGFSPGSAAAGWSLSDRVAIYLRILWPDGELHAFNKG